MFDICPVVCAELTAGAEPLTVSALSSTSRALEVAQSKLSKLNPPLEEIMFFLLLSFPGIQGMLTDMLAGKSVDFMTACEQATSCIADASGAGAPSVTV